MEQTNIIGTVVIGATAILTLYFMIAKPMLENQKTMTELICAIREFKDKLVALETNNTDSHRRIHVELDEHEKILNDHELRIHDLEKKEV